MMPIPKVRGIPNIGNTCYQNAALQLLISIPEFTDFVEKTNLFDHSHIQWLQKLFVFVRHYRSNPNDQEMLESLRDYYNEICLTKRVPTRQATLFRRGRQADTQEVYDTIIQTLIENYPDYLRYNQDLLPQIHPFTSYLNIRYAYCYYLAADLEKQIPKKLSTRVVNQNMFFIPLAIGAPSPSVVIELSKLITEWRAPESEYKVDVNPSDSRRAIKQMSQSALHHMGKYFFIRLGREDPYSDGNKIDNKVIMPHLYNFRALLDDDPENNNKHCYALIGIIHHYGQSLNRGHYTASILSDGQWMLCDDSDIRPHTPFEIRELAESSTGYIYLYRKLDGLSTQSADRFLPYGDGLNYSDLVFTTPDPYFTHSSISIVGEEFEKRFGGLFGDDSDSLPPGFDE